MRVFRVCERVNIRSFMLRDLPPIHRAEAELKFLSQAGETLGSSLDYHLTLDVLAKSAVPKLADWCTIDVLDENGTLERVATHHADPTKVRLAAAFAAKWPVRIEERGGVGDVLRSGQATLVSSSSMDDLSSRAIDEAQAEFLRRFAFHSWILVPIVFGSQVMGCLTLAQAETPRRFDEEDLTFVKDLARRVGVHVQNARLYMEAQRQRQVFETLHLVGSDLAAELDLDRVVRRLTDAATTLSNAEFGAFFFNSDRAADDSFKVYPLAGNSNGTFSSFPRHTAGPLFDLTFTSKGITRNDDVSLDPRFGEAAPHHKLMTGFRPMKSYLAVPVVSRSGEALGGLFFGHTRAGVFTVLSEQLVASLASQAAIAIDNARLFNRANALISDLERANRELDKFAYVASHDLRAPLRGISTLTEFLVEDLGEVPPIANEHLMNIRGRVRHMERLIQGILDYSRAGRSDEKIDLVEPSAVLGTLVELLDAKAIVTFPPEIPSVKTNRVHLEQVLLNLIGNALKHSKRTDKKIEVSFKEEGRFLQLAVADNGPGIAVEFRERIFGIFQTLDARSSENTGIGLAVVQRIVEMNGGRVWVETSPAGGAEFRFTWPREKSA